mgnify:CR=1 FL=1
MTPSSSRSAGRAPALLDSAGFRAAVIGSFTKLAPQHAFKNPVMAVVWLGTLLTAGLTLAGTTTAGIGWSVTGCIWMPCGMTSCFSPLWISVAVAFRNWPVSIALITSAFLRLMATGASSPP